jgi:SAM-dependent methyltransferase
MSYYDETFYQWVNATARNSARIVLPIVLEQARPTSVVDVGCGQGAWLEHWTELGVCDVYGVDGSHVDTTRLLIPSERFQVADLAQPFDIERRFDIAQSLEVAEHLPPEAGPSFVRNLCKLSDIVLFSAARPGQGGERHVNERTPSYWAKQFALNGYDVFDSIRPRLLNSREVSPWYRYNSFLYANADGRRRLSGLDPRSQVSSPRRLDSTGDWKWEARCLLLRPLPEPMVTWLSRQRYRHVIKAGKLPAPASRAGGRS